MVNFFFLNICVSRSTAFAEASTRISSACDILDVGYASPNCSCRCSNPSQPQTLQIPVNSAKHRHIFSTESFPYLFARTEKRKRCTFCKHYSVNSCQEGPPSFTFHILSVHQFMLLTGYPLLQYLSIVQVLLVGNIQNYWSFFKNIVLYLLGNFAQNPVMPGSFCDF